MKISLLAMLARLKTQGLILIPLLSIGSFRGRRASVFHYVFFSLSVLEGKGENNAWH
jgi:hypothetical protein